MKIQQMKSYLQLKNDFGMITNTSHLQYVVLEWKNGRKKLMF